MGQQQLLLLVLGIVIVGLAVVVGIQAFGENQKKANSDALVNDAVRIASDAQAWKLKPAAFGGGAAATGMEGFTLQQVGYDVVGGADAALYDNLNGVFDIGTPTATALTIIARNADNNNEVHVGVFGTTPDCIATAVGSVDAPPTTPTAPTGCAF
jgi:hypothetical protein